MSQFYCNRKGGIKIDGLLAIFEGTKEKGPWYNASSFSDEQIERWLASGWITFMEKEVA